MILRNLFILGDIGYLNKNLCKVVQNINKNILKNDIIAILGDNFYPNGVYGLQDPKWSTFDDIFRETKNPIYSILGNHDYLQNPECQIKYKNWKMKDWYFKEEFDNIDLYFLDTSQFLISDWVEESKLEDVHGTNVSTLIYNQIDWIDREMKENEKKKKIVIGHYPLITNGVYKSKMNLFYDYLIDCFRRNNVNIYISGHEHNIQYIKRDIDDYEFNQIIIGSSCDVRPWENNYCIENDMFDGKEIFYGKLSINKSNVLIEYINDKGETKYKYKINF